MASFTQRQSLAAFQRFIQQVYGLPDDRMFSLSDLLSNQERFTMRAIKGIRKNDTKKLKTNLLISLSWLMSVANRMHIDLEQEVWHRFPNVCSYCGRAPCACKQKKRATRLRVIPRKASKPSSLAMMQTMFERIYPSASRSLPTAGVHLAEEMGEVSEAVHIFLGEHKPKQFEMIGHELADYLSCVFGVANSARINVAEELARSFKRNCHVCHHAPCTCGFSFVATYKS